MKIQNRGRGERAPLKMLAMLAVSLHAAAVMANTSVAGHAPDALSNGADLLEFLGGIDSPASATDTLAGVVQPLPGGARATGEGSGLAGSAGLGVGNGVGSGGVGRSGIGGGTGGDAGIAGGAGVGVASPGTAHSGLGGAGTAGTGVGGTAAGGTGDGSAGTGSTGATATGSAGKKCGSPSNR